jgi:ribosomal protein L37AE/L43A
MATALEACENCGRSIGKLETAHVWNESIVCDACQKVLAAAEPPPPVDVHTDNAIVTGVAAELGIDPLARFEVEQREAQASTSCPRCKSPDTALLYMVHEQGTTQTASSGVLLGDVGGLMLGGSTSTTGFAARSAPPAKRSDIAWVVAVVVLAAWVWIAIKIYSSNTLVNVPACWAGSAIAALIVGLAGWIGLGAFYWNHTTWPILHAEWKRTWICKRCGTRFKPQSMSSGSVRVSSVPARALPQQ